MMTGGRNCSHCGARLGTRDRVCFSCQRESEPASPSGSDGSAAGADVAGTTRKAGHLPQAGSGSTAIRVAERQAAERAGPERSLQLELIWGNCPACGDGPMPNDRFCQSCGTEIRSAGASSPTRRSMPADHVGMPCARRRGFARDAAHGIHSAQPVGLQSCQISHEIYEPTIKQLDACVA